ncbi:hypothetical protein [Asaia bogorensis]|uniref:hypothetical protein n=1 Tax=Asaia bogorensis TaxID=91915 RepID=UPI000EFA7320|nr:hypothetical protein [Asaia bogorensis]
MTKIFEIEGFHTCLDSPNRSALAKQVPFLSHKNDQWLGQGYYFWTEEPYWAHKWNPRPKYGHPSRQKIVCAFDITLPEEKFLDLLTLKGQRWIMTASMVLAEVLKRDASVSEVFYYLLDKRRGNTAFFPYIAVRMRDNRSEGKLPIMKPNPKSAWQRGETFSFGERHQMCVYQHYTSEPSATIKFKNFVLETED